MTAKKSKSTKSTGKAAAKTKKPVKKSTSKASLLSKKAFVLDFPPTTPAKEIVQAGKKKGLNIGEHYVYTIRSEAKSGKGGTSSTSSDLIKMNKVAQKVINSSDSKEAESEFVMLAVHKIGMERAMTLLESVSKKMGPLVKKSAS